MSFLSKLAYVEDVRPILVQCVTFGKTGEIDEDLLDVNLGLNAINKLKQLESEEDSDSFVRQDFDSSEEQG